SSGQVVRSLSIPHEHSGGMHSSVGVTSRETFPGIVLLGGPVNDAQKVSRHGRLETLPTIGLRQVFRHDFRFARFYSNSALFGLSYLTTLVLSHLCPHAIQITQVLDCVCHSGDLPEAQPVKWQKVNDCGVKALQANPFA